MFRPREKRVQSKQARKHKLSRQPNKQKVESSHRHSLPTWPKKQKGLGSNGNNAKDNVDYKRLAIQYRENLDSFSLSILSEISQTEYVR